MSLGEGKRLKTEEKDKLNLCWKDYCKKQKVKGTNHCKRHLKK